MTSIDSMTDSKTDFMTDSKNKFPSCWDSEPVQPYIVHQRACKCDVCKMYRKLNESIKLESNTIYGDLHISFMRRACENHNIEFFYDLMPEFFEWAKKGGRPISYESMEGFIDKLLKLPINPLEHSLATRTLDDICNNTYFFKRVYYCKNVALYGVCDLSIFEETQR